MEIGFFSQYSQMTKMAPEAFGGFFNRSLFPPMLNLQRFQVAATALKATGCL